MTAREFMDACNTFTQFGKIKDINFEMELWCEQLDKMDKLELRGFDFEDGTVVLGEYIDFGCDCCGGYYEDQTYDLDDLARNGYLGDLIDMMDEVLRAKTGV
jgi:hypothetical protein